MLNFDRSTKRWDDNDVLTFQFRPRDKLMSIGVHNKFDAAALKVIVHLLVVNHLAEQKNSFVRIFLNCLVADFNGIFHAITKSEMTGDVKLNGAKI